MLIKTTQALLKVTSALALAAITVGCATTQRFHERMPFPVEEYASYEATGDSTVSGTATIERYKPEVSNARNPVHEIFLLPMTSYSWQAVDIAFVPCYRLAPPDPRQEQYVRRLPLIKNGSFVVNFEFKNVPAGKYFVVDRVTYDVDNSPDKTKFRVRAEKITVVAHKDNLNVQVKPPEDTRMGGEGCVDFR